jgi:hypothetical protein
MLNMVIIFILEQCFVIKNILTIINTQNKPNILNDMFGFSILYNINKKQNIWQKKYNM